MAGDGVSVGAEVIGGVALPVKVGVKTEEKTAFISTRSEVGEVKSLLQFLQGASLEDRGKVDYDMDSWRKLMHSWIQDTGSKMELMKHLTKDGDVNKYMMSLYTEDFSSPKMDKFLSDIANLGLKNEDMVRLLPEIRALAGFFGERVGAGVTLLSLKQMRDENLHETTEKSFIESLSPEVKQFIAELQEFATGEEITALFAKPDEQVSPEDQYFSEKSEETESKEAVQTGNFKMIKGGVAHPDQALDTVHWNGGDYAISAAELGISPDQIKTHGELEILMDTATGGGREASSDTKRFSEAFARYYYDSSNYGASDPQARAREAYDYAKGMAPAQAAFAYLIRQGDTLSVGAVGNINVAKQKADGSAQYILDQNSQARSAFVDEENNGSQIFEDQLGSEDKILWAERVKNNPGRFKKVSATVLIASNNARLSQAQFNLAKGETGLAHTDGFQARPPDYQGKNVAEMIAATNSGDDVMAILLKN